MNRTLGLDLGSNSLGWAILDDITSDIVDKGVVVFPEGADLDAGSSLETPAATRRAARMGRRMRFRRKMRKWYLLKLLIGEKMCPLKFEELEAWKKLGKYPIENTEFLNWLKATDDLNPYCDRDAASRSKVAPYVLGRALYHICQRRGFKSSRKEEASLIDEETGEEKPQSDKELGVVKGDIAKLCEEIESAGCMTLGQYFYKRLEEEKGKKEKTRIRCRYTGRIEHYEEEFKVIMLAQGYATSDKFYKEVHEAIFWQRPLRSQSHLVGNCPLEVRNPRAQIGHPAFEEFRMRAFVNNLTLEDEEGNWRDEEGNFLYALTLEDREAICNKVSQIKKPTFKTLKQLFKKDVRFAEQKLHFHYYDDNDEIPSCPTRTRIAEAFGEIEYNEQMVFDALTFYDDREKLALWFRKHYPTLNDKQVKSLSSIYPKEGNANYSLKAINRILPFLRLGYELSHARFCAKLPDVIEDYEKNQELVLRRLEEIKIQHRRDKQERAMVAPQIRKNLPGLPTLYERYAEMLRDEFGVTDKDFKSLYLRNDEAYVPLPVMKRDERGNIMRDEDGKNVVVTRIDGKPLMRLPQVQLGMIRNPLVQRSMTTLRRLVNYLAEHGKIDENDTIRIELARTVNDFATRKAWQLWQKGRKALRDEAAAEIAKYGKAATEDAIERYVLWKEQNCHCLYTGRNISIAELLDGNIFDVEHTLPRSLSGDDGLVNKTICEAKYNRQEKQGRVPKDCSNWDEIDTRLTDWRNKLRQLEKDYDSQIRKSRGVTDPDARCKARVKALTTRFERDYWREKLRRFDMEMDKLAVRAGKGLGFKKRQLVDTGIMCSHAVDMLKCLYPNTFGVNGAATAFARKAWGIQTDEVKDRTEHTHHAVDAMVIAALTPARFTAICTALKDDGQSRADERKICPSPCDGFAEKVHLAAEEILVKHVQMQSVLKQSSKKTPRPSGKFSKDPKTGRIIKSYVSRGDTVRGQLHKDTFYGCITDPKTSSLKKVVRKSLVGQLKDAEKIVDKIVDPSIRAIVEDGIEVLKTNEVKNIEAGMIKMPSGVPVNKVRIFMPTATNAWELRYHAMGSTKSYKRPYYVTSAEGSSFRLALFKLNGKFKAVAENSLEWCQNHKKEGYEPLSNNDGFVGYIMPGSMALAHAEGNPEELKKLSQKELSKRLYKVVKFTSTGVMTLRRHIEARASVVLSSDLKAAGKLSHGESKIELELPHELLLVSPSTYGNQMLFEGIHFRMMLDGSIRFF